MITDEEVEREAKWLHALGFAAVGESPYPWDDEDEVTKTLLRAVARGTLERMSYTIMVYVAGQWVAHGKPLDRADAVEAFRNYVSGAGRGKRVRLVREDGLVVDERTP
jgi:hypothetical protein